MKAFLSNALKAFVITVPIIWFASIFGLGILFGLSFKVALAGYKEAKDFGADDVKDWWEEIQELCSYRWRG